MNDLRHLLRWAQRAYAEEPPPRLHDRDIADDGAPDHTPEAERYFGMDAPRLDNDPRWTQPDDPRRTACRVDRESGHYLTPLRCAIEQEPEVRRRAILRAVLPDLFNPGEAISAAGEWWGGDDLAAGDVLFVTLLRLRQRYTTKPIPKRVGWVDKSESQQKAEEAA